MAKDKLKVVWAIIKARWVSNNLRFFIKRNIGMESAMGGINLLINTPIFNNLFPGNLNLVKPQEATAPKITEIAVEDKAIIRLLNIYLVKGLSIKTPI